MSTLRERVLSLSLKAKLSLAGAALVLLAVAVTLSLAWWMLRNDVGRGITDAQQALVGSISRELDERVQTRREALVMAAAVLSQQPTLPDAEELERHFASRPSVRNLFDVLFVTDTSGRIVYDTPQLPGRRGGSIADRDYFGEVMASGEPVLSRPFAAKTSKQPGLAFAVPLRGPDGQLLGMLGGTMFLNRPNFLTDVGAARIGREGHFVLVVKGEPAVVLMHPRAERILGPVAEAIAPSMVRGALDGFEGTLQGRTVSGTEALFTYQSLRNAPWLVAAVYPTSEAFASLRERERAVLGAGALVAVLAGWALWLLVQRLLRPLDQLRVVMNTDADQPEAALTRATAGSRELSAVVRAYLRARERQQASESALRFSEERLRTIADNMPATIAYIDAGERYRFTNAQYRVLYGVDPQSMIGRTPLEVFGEDTYQGLRQPIASALRGERVRFEHHIEQGDHAHHMSFDYIPDIAGGKVLGFYVMAQDVTAARLAEQQRLRSEARLRAIADNLPAWISHVDLQERYTFVNAYFQRVFGMEPAAVVGRTVRELRGEEVYAQVAPHLEAALRGERRSFEGHAVMNGRAYDFEQSYVPDFDERGRVQGLYSLMVDVTERRASERALAESEQRLRTITDNTPALVTHLDAQLRYRFCNKTLYEWTGRKPEEVLGRTMAEAFGEESFRLRREQLRRVLAGEQVEFEAELRMNGVRRVLRSVYVPDRAADGSVVGVYTMGFDVTALKDVEQQLHALARFDTLTGLPNRRQFEERLAEAMARCRRAGRPMALMFLDLDRFKAINDNMGHAAGDAVLKEFARRLAGCVRGTDMVARLAGDEFVVVLEGLNTAEEAQFVARKIVAAVRRPFEVDGQPVVTSTSVGIGYYGGDALMTPEELTAKADQALYQVKGAGRNAFRVVMC